MRHAWHSTRTVLKRVACLLGEYAPLVPALRAVIEIAEYVVGFRKRDAAAEQTRQMRYYWYGIRRTLRRTAQFIKDYWTLVLIPGTILGVVEGISKVEERNAAVNQVRYNNRVGIVLLDAGYYEEAEQAFARALELREYDRLALQGRRLSELMLARRSRTWVQNVDWIGMQGIGAGLDPRLLHVVHKFKGELQIADSTKLRHFRKALRLKPRYIEALLRIAEVFEKSANRMYRDSTTEDTAYPAFRESTCTLWDSAILYSDSAARSDTHHLMALCHLCFTLYNRASWELDSARQDSLLHSAASCAQRAGRLNPLAIPVLLQLGSALRPVAPESALTYHGARLDGVLGDTLLMGMLENRLPMRFTYRRKRALLATPRDLRAYADYCRALDNLVLYRMTANPKYDTSYSYYRRRAANRDTERRALQLYLLDSLELGQFRIRHR